MVASQSVQTAETIGIYEEQAEADIAVAALARQLGLRRVRGKAPRFGMFVFAAPVEVPPAQATTAGR